MPKHILMIDDEQPIRELLGQYLVSCGYEVSGAGTSHEAFALVDKQAPDLIISDLQLEDSDGIEMIAHLKERLPSVPVILLTGVLFDPDVVHQVLSKHVSCYLEKTSPLSKILAAVHDLAGPEKSSG